MQLIEVTEVFAPELGFYIARRRRGGFFSKLGRGYMGSVFLEIKRIMSNTLLNLGYQRIFFSYLHYQI